MGVILGGQDMGAPYLNGARHNAFMDGNQIWAGSKPFNGLIMEVSGTSFIVPTNGTSGGSSVYGSYDVDIDWDDGTAIQHVTGQSAVTAGGINHTFADGRDYHRIKISGNLRGIGFVSGTAGGSVVANKSKVIRLGGRLTAQNKAIGLVTYACGNMFTGCTNLVFIGRGFLPEQNPLDYSYTSMFNGCSSLERLPEDMLMSLPKNAPASAMNTMFSSCTRLAHIPMTPEWFKGRSSSSTNKTFSACSGIVSNTAYAAIPADWK